MKHDNRLAAALEKLEEAIIPPDLLEDEALSYVVRPLAVINALGVIVSIVYAIIWVFVLPERAERMVFPLAIGLCSFLVVVLIRMRRVIDARNLTMMMSWVVLTVTVLTAGGIRSPLFSMYSVVVLSAALYAGWRVALYYAGLTTVLSLAMLIADPDGTIMVPFATPQSAWLSQMSAMACACSMAYFMLQRSTDSLKRTGQMLETLKAAQESLSQSEERFRVIASITSDYTFSTEARETTDTKAVYSLLTGAFEEITGYNATEFLERGGWRSTVHPDDLAQDDRDMEKLKANQPVVSELRIVKKGGEVRWVRIHAIPIFDDEKKQLRRINGGVRDITDRKQAEDSLKRSEAHLRALVNASTSIAFLMARDGTFLTLNQTLAQSLGKPLESLIGQNAFDYMIPALREQRTVRFNEVTETREPVRWEDETRDGVWDNSVYPVLSSAGEVEAFAVYSRNVTARKRLEAEVRQYTQQLETLVNQRTAALQFANEQLKLVLDNTQDGLAFADAEGTILVANPAFWNIFPDLVSEGLQPFAPWSLSDEAQIVEMNEALAKVRHGQERQQLHIQIRKKNGHEQEFELSFLPVQSAEDPKAGILVHAHDITQMKEIERFKTRFVDNAVHDLATPISGMSTRLYLLKKNPEALHEHVSALDNQIRHLRNLLNDLRTLSQIDRGEIALQFEMCDANELIQLVFDTYEPVAMEKNQTLVLHRDPSVGPVYLDPRQMERVLVNLVSNAVNYTPPNKSIRIETCYQENYLLIRVTDQGIGVSAEDLPHIFERFYRANEARAMQATGTGLGLAITREIIELHNGKITVESEMGQGSRFSVFLPR